MSNDKAQILDEISKEIQTCSRCPLRETATNPVAGWGSYNAEYVICGEAPGREEDRAGIPFVGQAGRRLNQLLALAGIPLNNCYLTNVCRCRPPNNRTPRKGEVRACSPFFFAELEAIRPKYLITLGATPLQLFTKSGISQLHGTVMNVKVGDVALVLMPMYHPAAALHNPRLWAVILDDFQHRAECVPHDYHVSETPPASGQDYAIDVETSPNGSLGVWSVAYRNSEGKLVVNPYNGARRGHQWGTGSAVFHNAKFDLRVLARNGMPLPEKVNDTMIAAYCLGLGRQAPKDNSKSTSGSDMVGGLGLKYLARRHLGMEMKTWEDVKGANDADFAEYNANDSVATFLLWEKWKDKLPWHYWHIDMPLLFVLMAMEDRGIQVDPNFLDEYARSLDAQLAEIKLPFKPFSAKEVREYVYGKLGIKPWKFTATKEPSIEAEVLETIDDPVVKDLLRYKSLYHERVASAGGYVKYIDPNGRIHTEFKQVATSTGRLASARPNLQNVVKDSDMRRLFVAPPGMLLVRMDFNQLELRFLAAITQDPRMLEAFAKGEDIHQATADALGITRHQAKTNNFLTVYGGTAWKIASEFHISIDQAKRFQEQYFAKFPGIKQYMLEQRQRANEEREVVNYFGRRRRIDAMFSDDWRVIQEGEREAINTPIQGGAGDVVKLVMIDLHYRHACPMIHQVHDEILFEYPEAEAVERARWLKEYVPTIIEVNGVRFPVEVGVGKNWKEASSNTI